MSDTTPPAYLPTAGQLSPDVIRIGDTVRLASGNPSIAAGTYEVVEHTKGLNGTRYEDRIRVSYFINDDQTRYTTMPAHSTQVIELNGEPVSIAGERPYQVKLPGAGHAYNAEHSFDDWDAALAFAKVTNAEGILDIWSGTFSYVS